MKKYKKQLKEATTRQTQNFEKVMAFIVKSQDSESNTLIVGYIFLTFLYWVIDPSITSYYTGDRYYFINEQLAIRSIEVVDNRYISVIH